MPKFYFPLFFLFQILLHPISDAEEANLMGPQIADFYGANYLSLTDAAQIIEFLAGIMNTNDLHRNKEDLQKLNRMTFWTCAEFVPPNQGFLGIGKEKMAEWQFGYSKRLCQNMYKLLAMVDIELMMFYIKLDDKVNDAHFLGFLHSDEKHVRDVDLHNFKLSRMFAFARILTIRFLQLANNSKMLNGPKFGHKSVDNVHYMDLLREFGKRTEELLQLISNSTKFKTAQKGETLWSWLKGSKEKVLEKLNDNVKKEHCFQKDYEMLISIYEKMELGVKVDRPRLEGIYEGQKPWYKFVWENEEEKAHSGMFELMKQSPWFFPRIHKMVDIFGQMKEFKGGEMKEKQQKQKGQNDREEMREEAEMKEHPEMWRLIDKQDKEKSIQLEPIAKFNEENVLNLLQLFATHEFDELRKNTGQNAFDIFFDLQIPLMVDLPNVEGPLSAVRKFIFKKVEKTMNSMNLDVLRVCAHEIPIKLGAELLSFLEENVFTLGAFYKFSVELAKKYKIIKNGKRSNSEEDIYGKIKSLFGGNEKNGHQMLEKTKSKKKLGAFKNSFRKISLGKIGKKLGITKRESGFNEKFVEAMSTLGLTMNGAKLDRQNPGMGVVIFQYKLEELKDEIGKNEELKMLKLAMKSGKEKEKLDWLEEMNFDGDFEIYI